MISVNTSRGRLVAGLAVLLFAWFWLFRFAPLGGAFGGFDNDHFLHFSYAKQVEAGAQPLRDFLDAGLQGARPSLTYELSAWAQRLLGDDLRSEALLTVTGVAFAAAVTFVAGASLAAWPWALATALLAGFASPKLYSYPKVLVLSVIALLLVGYASRPARWRLAAMVAWTAIAFLFRHDYAVYCGFGVAVVVVATHWRQPALATRRLLAFGLLTALLLSPSLWWIHHYTGLVEYGRNGLEMSERESARTRLNQWPRPVLTAPGTPAALLDREENTDAWLYYLFLAIPLVAGVTAVSRKPVPGLEWHRSVVPALALMSLVLWRTFLRGNLDARFGEMAPLVAILGAWLLDGVLKAGVGGLAVRVIRIAAVVAILCVTTACIWVQQSVSSELRTGKLLAHPLDMADRVRRTSAELQSLPEALRREPDGVSMVTAHYLHACTRPTDRVFLMAYAPELTVFSERLFAGGRATVVSGFYADPRYSRRALAWLAAESVPITLVETNQNSDLLERFPLLTEYLRDHYDEVGTVGSWRLLVERGRPSTGTTSAGLPCFN